MIYRAQTAGPHCTALFALTGLNGKQLMAALFQGSFAAHTLAEQR